MNKHIKVRISQLLHLAEASPCPRRKFGAMIYDPDSKALVADGYNGSPRGGGHLCGGSSCHRDGKPRQVKTLEVHHGVVLFINEVAVPPVNQADPFVTLKDGTMGLVFNSQREAQDYERRTRPDAVKSGTQVQVGCHHAEMNAICNAARLGAATQGRWMLVTGEPCLMCAKLIHHAGIVQVVCVDNGYSGENGVAYLEEHGVRVVKVGGPKDER